MERVAPRIDAAKAPGERMAWLAPVLAAILLVPRSLEATPRRAMHWREFVAAASRLPAQGVGSLEDPEQIGALLPAGTRVQRYEPPGGDPAVTQVLLSAMEIAFSVQSASHAAAVEELFGSGRFELVSFREGVWTFARIP